MFKILALATLLIVASSTSTGFESIFAQAPKSEFASSVNSLLQMHSMNEDTDSRLKEISDLLYELQAMIQTNQEEADSYIEQFRTQCSTNEERQRQMIEEYTYGKNKYEEEISTLNSEKTEKTSQLAELQEEYESLQVDIEEATSSLSEENESYANFSLNFDDAITACEEAIRLMSVIASGSHGDEAFIQMKRNSGVMFVQLSQRFDQVKSVLEAHVQAGGPAPFVQPIIDILSEMGSKNSVDTAKVQQIIELIQALLKRLREGLQVRKQQNEKTVLDLNTLIAKLTSQVGAISSQIEVITIRLRTISERVSQLNNIITEITFMLKLFNSSLERLLADCQAEEQLYTTESATRDANLAMLDELIKHFENSVAPNVGNVRDGQIE